MILPNQEKPSSDPSFGFTGITLYALVILNVTNRVLWPRVLIHHTASSREAYDTEQNFESMPSFTLSPFGEDKSVINLHLLGYMVYNSHPTPGYPSRCTCGLYLAPFIDRLGESKTDEHNSKQQLITPTIQ